MEAKIEQDYLFFSKKKMLYPEVPKALNFHFTISLTKIQPLCLLENVTSGNDEN